VFESRPVAQDPSRTSVLLAQVGERAIVEGGTRPSGAVVRLVQFTLGSCLLLASGCAAPLSQVATSEPATPNYSKMSLQLKPEMTEQEVIDTLGQPTKSEISTCAQNVGKPYKCKMLIYGVPMRITASSFFNRELIKTHLGHQLVALVTTLSDRRNRAR
jgi:hypothetical protein